MGIPGYGRTTRPEEPDERGRQHNVRYQHQAGARGRDPLHMAAQDTCLGLAFIVAVLTENRADDTACGSFDLQVSGCCQILWESGTELTLTLE